MYVVAIVAGSRRDGADDQHGEAADGATEAQTRARRAECSVSVTCRRCHRRRCHEDRRRDRLPDRHRAHLHGRRAAGEDREEARPHHQGRDAGRDGHRERAVARRTSTRPTSPSSPPTSRSSGPSGSTAIRKVEVPVQPVIKNPEAVFAQALTGLAPHGACRTTASPARCRTGIHARPASALEQVARRFAADISLTNERTGRTANAKSVLGIVGLDIRHGDRVPHRRRRAAMQRGAIESLARLRRARRCRTCDDVLAACADARRAR